MRGFGAGLIAGLWGLGGAASAQEVAWSPPDLPPPGATACPGGICQVEALNPAFEAMAAAETPFRPGQGGEGARGPRQVHILQLGDSHTAGDRITGRVRAVLQARFGDVGRGVLPPGPLYEGYAPYQVEMTSAGWTLVLAPLANGAGYTTPGVGLAGVQAIALGPGAELRLRPETRDGSFHHVSVCGEGRGRFGAEIDEERWPEREFAGYANDRTCVGMLANGPPEEIVLRPLDGTLMLHDVRLHNLVSPGVTLSNLGVVGATLRDLAARDEAVVAMQLARWRPDLIILAYGTNEGFEDGLDATAYEALLRGQIERLQRLAPAAALMILGAPDALRNGVEGGCSADGRRAPPPSLAVVRDVQRRVAADTGVAFWDWHGRMGGDCSSDRLALRPEPLMRGDRVHFTSAGADWIGGIFADDLLAAYEAWKAGR